jgi:hypothetical protein
MTAVILVSRTAGLVGVYAAVLAVAFSWSVQTIWNRVVVPKTGLRRVSLFTLLMLWVAIQFLMGLL